MTNRKKSTARGRPGGRAARKPRKTKPRAAHGLSAYPPGLVRTWLEAEINDSGCTKAGALRLLNKATGGGVLANRLYEWLTLRHDPPRAVREHMLRRALALRLLRLLGRAPDRKTLDALARDLA